MGDKKSGKKISAMLWDKKDLVAPTEFNPTLLLRSPGISWADASIVCTALGGDFNNDSFPV